MSPLSGLTVLDLSRVLSGPFCTMQLADMGARVIKIEHPIHGDDTRAWGPPWVPGGSTRESSYFLSTNRNKESVALDFKTAEGRDLLDRLVAKADVLVENFRPGSLAKIGFDYASLGPKFPRLIYASISGFGQTGPRSAEAGYDAMIQAEGGLMSITGRADSQPVRLGVAISDIAAGMMATQGILLALIARGTTGRGQHVDISMFDTTLALLTYQAQRTLITGVPPVRSGNRHASIAPYDTFSVSDGTLVLAVGNDDQWQRFCRAAHLGAASRDPRFATNDARVRHYDALHPIIAAALQTETVETWLARLREAGVPVGAVRSIDEVLADAQTAARDMVTQVSHPSVGDLPILGIPIKLSATPGQVRSAPPTLGQHTRAVLTKDLGVSPAEFLALADRGVVKCS
ncbi:MAG: CoA transferase [Acidobacteria bacterium]|nr:MAG: CoA transferase [Acidobacteriota bacterium]